MTAQSSRIVLFLAVMVAVIAFGFGNAFAGAISDRDFVRKAADANMLGVSLGEVAEQNGVSPEVKKFGQKMATDSILASNNLLEIAKKDNLGIPRDMDIGEHETLLHLSGLKGRDFDLAYLKQVVENNKENVALFEQMAKEGANRDLQTMPKRPSRPCASTFGQPRTFTAGLNDRGKPLKPA